MAETLAPLQLSKLIGLQPSEQIDHWLRGFGLREIGAGIGLLTAPHRAADLSKWMWARVAGDALDLAALGWAEADGRGWFRRGRTDALKAARQLLDRR